MCRVWTLCRDAAECDHVDAWYIDDDGNWQYGPVCDHDEDETDIGSEHSAFVGVPTDDETIIPHAVALEIARSLEDDEDTKPSADIYKQPVVGISKSSNLFLTFDSIADAARHTLTRGADIARVLRGERKSANGWI